MENNNIIILLYNNIIIIELNIFSLFIFFISKYISIEKIIKFVIKYFF